jgi:hypothetical protein
MAKTTKTRLLPVGEFNGVDGSWELHKHVSIYRGPGEGAEHPFGLAVSGQRFREGAVRLVVELADKTKSEGKVVIGYKNLNKPYLAAGLGGHNTAYDITEWIPSEGWQARATAGQRSSLVSGRPYRLEVALSDKEITLAVNATPVLDYKLPKPLGQGRIGLFAWGEHAVRFEDVQCAPDPISAFVAMQFSPRYEIVYREVIQGAAGNVGILAQNIGERLGPGSILEDIARGISQTTMVIAEVTPKNQNVYYEVGYAHALGKPTILLAKKGTELPFDLKIHRCLFYENNREGREAARRQLQRYIGAVLKAQGLD